MALLLQITQKLSQGFAALWSRYPNKSAKKDAEKAFTQVVKTAEIEEEIHHALDWQIPHWETMEWYHPPYLATYLRKERFRDEKPTTTTRSRITDPWDQQRKTAEVRRLMQDEGLTREEAVQRVYP